MRNGIAARGLMVIGVAAALTATTIGTANACPVPIDRTLPANTQFYVDLKSKALAQAATDLKAHDWNNAKLMAELGSYPESTWFTGNGTPDQAKADVAAVMAKAGRQHQVPVLVAYNVPGRDCSQYSAGGASDTASYLAWIDGFAAGIGSGKAVVILEPDGLALGPGDCGGTAAQQADRVLQINKAIERIEAQPKAIVYLDAGHSGWHAVGDTAQRLIDGGIAKAQGFFLNVSNYRTDAELTRYGTMVSKCIWYVQNVAGATSGSCANQYWPVADADNWYATNVPATAKSPHFVVDSSRNGQGPWPVAAGTYPDNQDWCNPPDRGLGTRPTANTKTALLDAYLWVKIPGESDGSCTRDTAGPGDPVYNNTVDPAAGAWWPDQVHGLAARANPPLTFNLPPRH